VVGARSFSEEWITGGNRFPDDKDFHYVGEIFARQVAFDEGLAGYRHGRRAFATRLRDPIERLARLLARTGKAALSRCQQRWL